MPNRIQSAGEYSQNPEQEQPEQLKHDNDIDWILACFVAIGGAAYGLFLCIATPVWELVRWFCWDCWNDEYGTPRKDAK